MGGNEGESKKGIRKEGWRDEREGKKEGLVGLKV